jgi:AcrR family transcriptional regulator
VGDGVSKIALRRLTDRSVTHTVSVTTAPADQPARTVRRGRPGYDVESLLAVSAEVFTRKGFDGTSMEDLAARLGITKSAIYHHVSGKNQLLELAVGRALDGLAGAVEASLALDGPAIERLSYLVEASVRVLVEQKPFVTLLLRVRGNTDVERRALDRRKEFDRYVADLVAQAEDEGAVRPDLDPATTARLLFGMVNSLTEWARPTSPEEVDALAAAVAAVAFDGIRARPA